MAEKPRIKDTEQIFDSVGKKRERTQPLMFQSDAVAPPEPAAPADSEGSQSKRRGRPRKGGAAAPQQERTPEETAERLRANEERILQEQNPLDFGKYELPQPAKRRGRPRKNPEPARPAAQQAAEPEERPVPAPARQAEPGPVEQQTAPRAEEAAEPPKPIAKAEEVHFQEFAFEDLEEQERQKERDRVRAEARRAREEAMEQEAWERAEIERLRKQAAEEAERARLEAEEEARRTIAEAEQKAARAREEAEEKARQAHETAEREAERLRLEKESRRKLIEDETYREDVLGKLGDEFEQQFSKRFQEPEAGEDKPWWLEERREGLGKPIRDQQQPDPPPAPERQPATEEELKARREAVLRMAERETEGPARPPEQPEPREQEEPIAMVLDFPQFQDREVEEEADSFVEQFRRDVREEEGVRDQEEDFRETLAQKFMRERERYLRDLGILDQVEAEEETEAGPVPEEPLPAPQQRRKLDLHILPEMHFPGGGGADAPAGDGPPPLPVTYNRIAQVEPMKLEPEPPPGVPETATVIAPDPDLSDGKKTAEQLLLELGELNRRRPAKRAGKPAQMNFRFSNVDDNGEQREEDGKQRTPRGRMMTRIIIVSAAAGLVIISLLAWAISAALRPMDNIVPGSEGVVANDDTDGVFTAYMNYNPDTMTYHPDVVVKRSGITLSNMSIQNRLVVEEEASAEGELVLSNVLVGDYIYINNSGINLLDLRDVTAERVVINNASKTVTVRTSGATDIGAVEIRTPAVIEQGDMIVDAAGIRAALVVTPDAAVEPLAVTVNEAKLTSLSTEGETQLTFADSSVERLTADGSLTLSGSGRVTELNFGSNLGGGAAGNSLPVLPVSLLVKGVEIGHLNVKSASNVNLSTQADSVAVSDPIILGGNGSIGTLTFNEKFGNGRLSVDISGLNIQHLVANTQVLVQSSGSSVINRLTANDSTYTIGNKVNILVANADGVIYEKEPDSRQIGQGIDPPQSKADNPHINYKLEYNFAVEADPIGASGAEGEEGEEEDGVSSACDHSRDVGGFIQGDGSKTNPYIVETAAQLAHISLHPDSHFLQGGNIDIAEDSSYADGFPGITARFAGTYDGGGYAIRNLRMYGDSESTGLFAENTGAIRNLNVESGEVGGSSRGYTGVIVGMNYAGGVVEACSNGATVNADSSAYAGGIVGYNYGGKIRDCYNTAKISCDGDAGGIAGMNRQDDASITGCYSIGVIEGEGNLGAVAGSNEAVVTNCYFLQSGELEGIGSGDGNVVSRDAERLSSSQMAAELAAGNENSLWQSGGDGGYAYPTLRKPEGLVLTND